MTANNQVAVILLLLLEAVVLAFISIPAEAEEIEEMQDFRAEFRTEKQTFREEVDRKTQEAIPRERRI